MSETNYILEGAFKGASITTDKDGYARLDHGSIYLDQENIKSVEKLNEESMLYKETVSFWLGSVTAAGVSDLKNYVIAIGWNDGQQSLAKVAEGMYTRILSTKMVNVKQIQQRKQELSDRQKNEKKYQLACDYQKSNDFIEAKRLFDELSNYKDSKERSQQIQKQIEQINNSHDKPQKIDTLKKEYKKYSRIAFAVSCFLLLFGVFLFISSFSFSDFLYVNDLDVLVILFANCTFYFGIFYLLMFFSFRKKTVRKPDLEKAYLSIQSNGYKPSKSFTILTIIFIVFITVISIVSLTSTFS